MIHLSASRQFDINNIDFTRIFTGFSSDRTGSLQDSPWEEFYQVIWIFNNQWFASSFVGSNFSISPDSVAGNLKGYIEQEWTGSEWLETYRIVGFEIDANKFYSAAISFDATATEDLLKELLSENITVYSSSFDDNIMTFDGNDIIYIFSGSNTIDAGAGQDTVVYELFREQISINTTTDDMIFVQKPGDQVDQLTSVERISFSDGSLVFDLDSQHLEFTYRIYAAAYGRTPDEDGLRFWINTMDHLAEVNPDLDLFGFLAMEFLGAPEFITLYGSDPSDMDYVDAMYQNVLARMPDEGGYEFWVNAMEAGLNRADILVYFAESPENQIQTAPDLDDGVWVL